MAAMKWKAVTRPGSTLPGSKAVQGLPRINYRLPLAVTLLATVFVLAVVVFLTLVSLGNAVTQWNKSEQPDASPGAVLFCGSFAVLGAIGSVYFLWAIVKGIRDLTGTVYYTRGRLADKRVIGGRLVGDWIGIHPTYTGYDAAQATQISDEDAAASVDRSQIVQTRGPAPAQPAPRRGSYLSPDRVSARTVVLEERSTGEPGPRVIFRVDPAAYDALNPGEEVLVAHSRYLEHIYYVAHVRNGDWESFRNKALI